jgi:hypothetical protein
VAWLIEQIPIGRWTVATTTIPPEDAELVWQTREAYVDAQPGVYEGAGSIFNKGLELPTNCFPKRVKLQSASRNPPDFLTVMGIGVSERIKRVVESFEPGRHQFVKVETLLKNGEHTPQLYYALLIRNVARHQVIDHLTIMSRQPSGAIDSPSPSHSGMVTINRKESRRWHLWISADISHHMTISDYVHALFQDIGVKGLNYTYLAESPCVDSEAL